MVARCRSTSSWPCCGGRTARRPLFWRRSAATRTANTATSAARPGAPPRHAEAARHAVVVRHAEAARHAGVVRHAGAARPAGMAVALEPLVPLRWLVALAARRPPVAHRTPPACAFLRLPPAC